jgi:hypothetical protein
MPRILILTGHPASGKTSLIKQPIFDDWIKLDIEVLMKGCDLSRDSDPRIYTELRREVFNNLFKGRDVCIELLGTERFFSHFRELCWKSSFRLIEVELQKVSLSVALDSMITRQDSMVDLQGLRSMYGIKLNPNASLFFTTQNTMLDFNRFERLLKGEK